VKKFLILIILLGIFEFYLTKSRPEWYLKALTHMPGVDTSMHVNFKSMNVTMNEAALIDSYNKHYLVCDDESSRLGDRVCWAYISSFNGIKADLAAFFFKKGVWRHLRVTFPDEVHPRLLSYLNDEYRVIGVSRGSKEKFGQELGMWATHEGTLSAYREPPIPGNVNMLLWNNKVVYDD
jgi:hypothetical protein